MYVETRYLKGMEEPELTPPPDLNYENPLIAWLYDRIIGPAAKAYAKDAYELLPPSFEPGAALLDVGCGGGQTLISLAERHPDLRSRPVDRSGGCAGPRRGRRAQGP